MLTCAQCNRVVGKLGDMHECTNGELKFCLAGGPVAPHAAASLVATGWGTGVSMMPGDVVTIAPPAPAKQRGGRFTVNGWIALALVVLATSQAITIARLMYRQPVITATSTVLQPEQGDTPAPAAPTHEEYYFNYSTGDAPSCGLFDTICWIRI